MSAVFSTILRNSRSNVKFRERRALKRFWLGNLLAIYLVRVYGGYFRTAFLQALPIGFLGHQCNPRTIKKCHFVNSCEHTRSSGIILVGMIKLLALIGCFSVGFISIDWSKCRSLTVEGVAFLHLRMYLAM